VSPPDPRRLSRSDAVVPLAERRLTREKAPAASTCRVQCPGGSLASRTRWPLLRGLRKVPCTSGDQKGGSSASGPLSSLSVGFPPAGIHGVAASLCNKTCAVGHRDGLQQHTEAAQGECGEGDEHVRHVGASKQAWRPVPNQLKRELDRAFPSVSPPAPRWVSTPAPVPRCIHLITVHARTASWSTREGESRVAPKQPYQWLHLSLFGNRQGVCELGGALRPRSLRGACKVNTRSTPKMERARATNPRLMAMIRQTTQPYSLTAL
jgi:hypothetical protein